MPGFVSNESYNIAMQNARDYSIGKASLCKHLEVGMGNGSTLAVALIYMRNVSFTYIILIAICVEHICQGYHTFGKDVF